MTESELERRAVKYCNNKSELELMEPKLGFGTDGTVWKTSAGTAVKVFEHGKNYSCERSRYRRLEFEGIVEIEGLAVPQLEGSDGELLVVEMTIVQPPYLLDSGKAYVDSPPPYLQERHVIEGMNDQIAELFEENELRVHSVMGSLRSIGIWYADPKPANIRF